MFLVFTAFLFAFPVFSQNKKAELQKNKQQIEEEIKYNSKLLDETRKTKKTTLNQLVILKKQIATREKLIANIQKQIASTEKQIELNNQILENLQHDLEQLKDEYAKMILYAYKNRNSFDRLIFIFASEDFNQAFKRIKYFQQYAAYRKTQADLINQTRDEIKITQAELELFRAEKFELMIDLKEEINQLAGSRQEQNSVYQTLTQKEKTLAQTIGEKEKAAKKLQKEIEKIIAEEIRLAAKKKGTTGTGSFALTPAELELSEDFEGSKGSLPWPVARGIISGTFGEHQHPVLKQVKTKNNGIDILTEKEMEVEAVFDGEVTRIISIPGYNYVVMIRHGEYLSVYSNLVEVFVTKGQKVKIHEKLGRVHTNAVESKTELHFEIWKGKTLLNPENWLAN